MEGSARPKDTEPVKYRSRDSEQEQDQCEKLGVGRIGAARGQVEQHRVGKYEFSALLPENRGVACGLRSQATA